MARTRLVRYSRSAQVPGVFGVLLLTLVVSSGCVERVLVIDSTPRGARVTINGHPAGLTPTGPIQFEHYGTYGILLERDGYTPLRAEWELRAPWHGRFPLDFFAEVLWPGRIIDSRSKLFTLMPLSPPHRAKLIENATRARDANPNVE